MIDRRDDSDIEIERRFVPKAKDINEDIAWAQINKDVLRSMERPRPMYWVIFAASLALFGFGVFCEVYQYQTGLGVGALHRHLHFLDWHEPLGHLTVRYFAHHACRLAQTYLSVC